MSNARRDAKLGPSPGRLDPHLLQNAMPCTLLRQIPYIALRHRLLPTSDRPSRAERDQHGPEGLGDLVRQRGLDLVFQVSLRIAFAHVSGLEPGVGRARSAIQVGMIGASR